jgi:mannose/cellobiose epimerase-like protein (N-acyl-D-glucosamine 2-epimerase family)
LRGPLRDAEHGGWFARLGSADGPDDRKQMYGHAFVVLAAASASTVGVPGARELLDEALTVVEQRFWDDDAGACRESFDRTWSDGEPYRGANSNMHAVEAFLAAADAGADPVWAQRALRIAERLIDDGAAAHRWRLPEHYDESWGVDLEYAADRPADPFRPYGVTIGHLLEWSRLLLHLEAALPHPPAWLVPDSRALMQTALEIGWRPDGQPGLVYTVDWSDAPVVAQRMHWVAAEGVLAAEALARRTARRRIRGLPTSCGRTRSGSSTSSGEAGCTSSRPTAVQRRPSGRASLTSTTRCRRCSCRTCRRLRRRRARSSRRVRGRADPLEYSAEWRTSFRDSDSHGRSTPPWSRR